MPIHSTLRSTITCISARRPPPEAVPLPAGAADAIETGGTACPACDYATALDGRKLCLIERRRGAKPGSECRTHRECRAHP